MNKIVSILFILFGSMLNAQEYFNKTFQQPNSNLSNCIIELDSGYLVLGQQITTEQRKILFYNLKRNGDTSWVKEYYDGIKIFYAMKLIKSGNDFLVLGSIKDSADTQNSDMFLASFDQNINLNWMQRYGGSQFDNGFDLKQTIDGGYILTGYKTISTPANPQISLIKTDSLGNVEWEQMYGDTAPDLAYSISITSDKGYIIGGTTLVLNNYDLLVLKVDSVGNEIWTKTFGTNYNDAGGGVIELNDHSYLVNSGFGINNSAYMPVLIKLNFEGAVIWQKQYASVGYTSFEAPLVVNPDNTITLCGITENSNNNTIGFIKKVDPFGNHIWDREYFTRQDSPQNIYDIKATSDGGYVFCGSAWDSVAQRAWVVKLDCFGCDSSLCYYQDSVCDVYDCTQFPISANFNTSDYIVNFANGEDTVEFVNSSGNTTNRVWHITGGTNSLDTVFYTDSSVSYSFSDTGTYQVSLIVYHGMCSDTVVQTIEVVDVLGLDENMSSPSIPLQRGKLYPNPNNGSFTVENNSGIPLMFEVYDALGKVVFRKVISEKTEQLELNLENGVYIAEFVQNSLSYQEKLVVQK